MKYFGNIYPVTRPTSSFFFFVISDFEEIGDNYELILFTGVGGNQWDWGLVPSDKFWWYVPKELYGTECDGIEKHKERWKRIRWREPIKVAVARVREVCFVS